MVLTRIMSLENYGYYVLAIATITILTVPTSLGLPNLLVRYISKYEAEGRYGEIKGILRLTNKLVLISFTIVIFISFVLFVFWWNTYEKILTDAIWLGFGVLLFSGLSSLRAATLRGLKFIILGQLPDTLIKNALIFGSILFCYLMDYNIYPRDVILIHLIAVIISFVIGYVFLYKKLLINLKKMSVVSNNKFWLKEAIPFTLNGSVQVVRSKMVTYVLAAIGSVESVAIYDIALRGGALVSFTLDAINLAIAPYISNAFQKNNKKSLQKIITKSSRIIFLSAIPITLVFILGGTWVIELLFGQEYISSYIPLIIVCIGQLLSSTIGSVGIILSMTGNMSYFTRNNIYITIINVLLSIPIVYYMDVQGAAILYSFLLIAQNIMLMMYIKKNLKLATTIF